MPRKRAEPMAAVGGRRRACALGSGAAGGRRAGWRRGAGRNAAELLPPPQPPPQRRGHVVWCVGRGEEEEGVKPREETGERHHTHTAQDGRRGSSTPSCQAFRRGRGTRRLAGELRPGGPQARGGRSGGGRGEIGRAPGSDPPRRRRPKRPGPTTPKAPLRQRPRRLPGVPAARPGAGDQALRGKRVRATSRCRRLALGPGKELPGPLYCPLSLGGKAKCP